MKRQLAILTLTAVLLGCGSDAAPIAQGCIKSTACNVKAYPRLSDCLDSYNNLQIPAGMAPVYDEIYRCADKAADCAAVQACHGVGQSCDNSFPASCAGGKALLCDLIDRTTFSFDCAAHGLGCEIKPAGGYVFDATCTGGSADHSSAKVDCGGGLCRSTGKACVTGNEFDRCDGERLEACIDDQWVSIDCANVGLGPCQPAQYGAACGGV